MQISRPRRIICCVTSDPAYDQRMIRICSALQRAGYDVTLVGRLRPNSGTLSVQPFQQVRLDMRRTDEGKLFYAIFWFKLFFFLLFRKADAVCAIDLDTILPVYAVSWLRGLHRVYDAHEIFTELEELVQRPRVQQLWRRIERFSVPKFPCGYTVSGSYADEFHRRYGVKYAIVRNATVLREQPADTPHGQGYILYQGAVNHGRCFEQLIPAMQHVSGKLIICGEGNYKAQAVQLATELGLREKIYFAGYIPPTELPAYTRGAAIGITLFTASSLSNKLSLANRFFDYMHAGVPQLAPAYPEYQRINAEFEVASLIEDPSPENIAHALNHLLHDNNYHAHLRAECARAKLIYNWQAEEARLLEVWSNVFSNAC